MSADLHMDHMRAHIQFLKEKNYMHFSCKTRFSLALLETEPRTSHSVDTHSSTGLCPCPPFAFKLFEERFYLCVLMYLCVCACACVSTWVHRNQKALNHLELKSPVFAEYLACYGASGTQTLFFMVAKQELLTTELKLWDRGLLSDPGWPWTWDTPDSVSQEAGITGVYHQRNCNFWFIYNSFHSSLILELRTAYLELRKNNTVSLAYRYL